MAAPANRAGFGQLLATLRANSQAIIVPLDETLFDKAVQLYLKRLDKEWSLTDCVSFIVMGEHGLTEALTGDHHFEQAGFQALLKP